jgi:hypothetical protein
VGLSLFILPGATSNEGCTGLRGARLECSGRAVRVSGTSIGVDRVARLSREESQPPLTSTEFGTRDRGCGKLTALDQGPKPLLRTLTSGVHSVMRVSAAMRR